jgi:hypothetical protein
VAAKPEKKAARKKSVTRANAKSAASVPRKTAAKRKKT